MLRILVIPYYNNNYMYPMEDYLLLTKEFYKYLLKGVKVKRNLSFLLSIPLRMLHH